MAEIKWSDSVQKLFLVLVLFLMCGSAAHAQVAGQSCAASGLNATNPATGLSFICTQNGTGSLVWTQIGGATVNGASTNPLGPVINVVFPSTLCPGCNATADWRTVADGVCTNSSNAWTSATLALTQADVGKKFWAGSSGATVTSASALSQFTVQTVTSGTAWTSSENTSGGSCASGLNVFMATDNSTAFNNAELAVHNSTSHKGIIFYPCGDYGVAGSIWNSNGVADAISYWGGGSSGSSNTTSCTHLHFSPGVGWTNASVVSTMNATTNMRDLTGDGDNLSVPSGAANAVFVSWSGPTHLNNVQFINFRSGASSQILCQENSDNFSADEPACRFIGALAFQFHSLDSIVNRPSFAGCPGADLADLANSVVTGGSIFPITGSCNALTSTGNSGVVGNATFVGTHFASGGNSATAIVSITKPGANAVSVTFIEPDFDNQGISNQLLLNVGAGAKVIISHGTIQGTGTTPTITNAGTIIDACGNQLGNTLTGVGVTNNCAAEPSIAGRCLLTSAASPLACVQAANGKVAVPVTTATYTINTTAVASGSTILVTPTTDNTGIPGAPACGAEVFGDGAITASVAGTSFTFAQTSAAVIKCYNWSIR